MEISNPANPFIQMGATQSGYWIPAPRFHEDRLRGNDGGAECQCN